MKNGWRYQSELEVWLDNPERRWNSVATIEQNGLFDNLLPVLALLADGDGIEAERVFREQYKGLIENHARELIESDTVPDEFFAHIADLEFFR